MEGAAVWWLIPPKARPPARYGLMRAPKGAGRRLAALAARANGDLDRVDRVEGRRARVGRRRVASGVEVLEADGLAEEGVEGAAGLRSGVGVHK